MRTLKKLVLHPKFEDISRIEAEAWCEENLTKKSWNTFSNYTDHGTFNLSVYGEEDWPAVTAFMLKYLDTIVIDSVYSESYEIAPETLSLFEDL